MKQEASGSGKRHDVRSIIASSPRSHHAMPPHPERARAYDEPLPKTRPSAVVSTASSLSRASPLALGGGAEPGGRTHHSPLGYEEHKGALRAPYPGSSLRGSPVSLRESGQRASEGIGICPDAYIFRKLSLKLNLGIHVCVTQDRQYGSHPG